MEYNEILESLLEGYEQGGHKDIDAFIKEKGQEMGLSKASLDKVEQASVLVDKLVENMDSLQTAKEQGHSLKRWMSDKLQETLSSLEDGDSKEKLVKLLSEKADSVIENQFKKKD